MAEYIEREAFIESQHNIYCVNCDRRKDSRGKFVYFVGDAPCRACGIMDVLDAVEDAPAADVRPVVFCRDCDCWNEWDSVGRESLGNYVCSCAHWSVEDGPILYTRPTDFCSYGEKREES